MLQTQLFQTSQFYFRYLHYFTLHIKFGNTLITFYVLIFQHQQFLPSAHIFAEVYTVCNKK